MNKNIYIILILSLILSKNGLADGLLIPSNKDYPTSYLKNKVSNIEVNITEGIAETIVTQEFENEWHQSVDGVFSFPLPPNARASRLLYSVGDTLIDAFLKVQQQSTNPGTGEGGEVAKINQYMGKNVIRIQLNKIPAYGLQTVQLHYISTVEQYGNNYLYEYPLNTSDFVKTPLDFFSFKISINSSETIIGGELLSHEGAKTISTSEHKLEIALLKPKAFLTNDLIFSYTIEKKEFTADLYSSKTDTANGYFTLINHPVLNNSAQVFQNSIVFALGNSSNMNGIKLDQSKLALQLSIDKLAASDSFNIVVFNSNTKSWSSNLQGATNANKSAAKEFVNEIQAQNGSNLQDGISVALNMLKDKQRNSSILVFSDGNSLIDPYEIEEKNINKIGIFIIAIGNEVNRARLETTAALNYGFVNYVSENDLLGSEMSKLFDKINNAIVKDVEISYDRNDIHSFYPKKATTLFEGIDFIQNGKYSNEGTVIISIEGQGKTSPFSIQFQKELNDQLNNNDFCRKLWAKQAIDELEARILIQGESDSLKNLLIDLSLSHNMRCRFTAFTTDTIHTDLTDTEEKEEGEWDDGIVTINNNLETNQSTRIILNYPNPVFDYTTVKIYISEKDEEKTKEFLIYDTTGRLIYKLNLSQLKEGYYEIALFANSQLKFEKGIHLLVLKKNNAVVSKRKMLVL